MKIINCKNIPSENIKYKIKQLIYNKIRPAVGVSKSGKLNDVIEHYNSNYKYIEWGNPIFLENHANDIYQNLVDCAWDYPEKYVHLLGYRGNDYHEYLADMLTVYEPSGNIYYTPPSDSEYREYPEYLD
jgi:hypothetical protein